VAEARGKAVQRQRFQLLKILLPAAGDYGFVFIGSKFKLDTTLG